MVLVPGAVQHGQRVARAGDVEGAAEIGLGLLVAPERPVGEGAARQEVCSFFGRSARLGRLGQGFGRGEARAGLVALALQDRDKIVDARGGERQRRGRQRNHRRRGCRRSTRCNRRGSNASARSRRRWVNGRSRSRRRHSLGLERAAARNLAAIRSEAQALRRQGAAQMPDPVVAAEGDADCEAAGLVERAAGRNLADLDRDLAVLLGRLGLNRQRVAPGVGAIEPSRPALVGRFGIWAAQQSGEGDGDDGSGTRGCAKALRRHGAALLRRAGERADDPLLISAHHSQGPARGNVRRFTLPAKGLPGQDADRQSTGI